MMKVTRVMTVETEVIYDTENEEVQDYLAMTAEEDAELMARQIKELLGVNSSRVVCVRELKND